MRDYLMLPEEDGHVLKRLRVYLLGSQYEAKLGSRAGILHGKLSVFDIFAFIFSLFCLLVFAISFRMGSDIRVTQEHARSFGGILAAVIPIFVVALFGEKSPRWNTGKSASDQVALYESPITAATIGKRDSVTPLQLLFCLFGEIFALSVILSPTRTLLELATISIAFLLFLFGIRLNEEVLASHLASRSKITGYIEFSSFLLFMFLFFGFFGRILRIVIVP